MKLKVIVPIIMIIMLAAQAAGISYAYLTDQKKIDNVFQIDTTDISIVEDFTVPSDPKPGMKIKKVPQIKNEAQQECYVRARVTFTSDGCSQCEPLQIMDGWEWNEDGFYYWKDKLLPQEMTAPLFKEVTLLQTIEEEDLKSFSIDIYAEAVCAGSFSMQDAWNSIKA